MCVYSVSSRRARACGHHAWPFCIATWLFRTTRVWPHTGQARLHLVWPWPGHGLAALAAPLVASRRLSCPAGPLYARPPLPLRLPLMLLLPSMSRVTAQSRLQLLPLPSCHSCTHVCSLHRVVPSLDRLGVVRTWLCTPSSHHY